MDTDQKKQVLRKMTYGLWVMTAHAGDDFEGSTVTWVSQMSFVPPLVVVGVRMSSHLHDVAERAGQFALHLIAEDKKDLAELFIKPTEIKDGKIAGLSHRPGEVTGAPILEGFPAWLELRTTEIVKKGDHSMFIAEVVGVGQSDAAAKPLVLATTGWHYGG